MTRISLFLLALATLCQSCGLLGGGGEPDYNITLSPTTLQMKVGDIQTITATGATDVEWTSSNDSVATVFYGVITAKAIGAATITAKKGNSSATCPVYVTGTDGASLRITPAVVNLSKGDTYQFQYGNTYDLETTWSSSDPDIAAIDQSGLVTAVAPGIATITLATNIESVTATVTVARQWGEYTLVWSDEFEGTSLDESVWNIEVYPSGVNKELQYYTARPENLRVQNGNLEIEARLETYENREYTSARINSKEKKVFQYGRIESRIKFPGGQGTWPAFWMMGNDYGTVGWPRCGEIDIIEHVGSNDAFASFALHTSEKNGDKGNNWHSGYTFDYPLSDDYHVYGIEWCQEEENGKDCIKFMVDGVVYATATETTIDDNRTWPFNKDHFIIFNMAIGGTMGGTVNDAIFDTPRIMYVDWVRVYQRTELEL